MIDASVVVHKKATTTESGRVLAPSYIAIKSKNGYEYDLSDYASVLASQADLIDAAEKKGSFGQGNINMWYRLGMNSGVDKYLLVLEYQGQE